MSSIPRNMADAVGHHIKALRLLGRAKTCVLSVAEALELEVGVVEQVLIDFKVPGATLSFDRMVSKSYPMSKVIDLKPH